MTHARRFCQIALIAALPVSTARAADPTETAKTSQERTDPLARIQQLTVENEALRAENAALKEKVAGLEKSAATRPTTRPSTLPVATFELGETTKLGNYQFRVPAGWTYQGVKDNKLGALYRSQDRAAVIMVIVRPRGAAPPEMQAKYAQTIIQKLREDFFKAKTEVIDPPAVIKDNRFFLKVHERIKIKDKVAEQMHVYLMQGKDLIELSVITTADATDQIASTMKLAEDVLLSCTLVK